VVELTLGTTQFEYSPPLEDGPSLRKLGGRRSFISSSYSSDRMVEILRYPIRYHDWHYIQMILDIRVEKSGTTESRTDTTVKNDDNDSTAVSPHRLLWIYEGRRPPNFSQVPTARSSTLIPQRISSEPGWHRLGSASGSGVGMDGAWYWIRNSPLPSVKIRLQNSPSYCLKIILSRFVGGLLQTIHRNPSNM